MTPTIPNILLFGETGVGKSSFINMLWGVPDDMSASMDSENPYFTRNRSTSPSDPAMSSFDSLAAPSARVSPRISIATSSYYQDPPPPPPIPNYGKQYQVQDTVGLNEGDLGRAPTAKAMAQLEHLVNNIAHKDGINLLVHCVRANRITQTTAKNYRVFYSALCRKKVPIVLVVLGLEH